MGRFEKGNHIGPRFPKGDAQRETARKGAMAANEKKRQIKSLKEALAILLDQDHTNKAGEVKKGYEVIAIGLYNKAMKGDTKAIKLLSELVGEYKQNVDLTSGGRVLNFINTDPETEANIRKLYDTDNGISEDDSSV